MKHIKIINFLIILILLLINRGFPGIYEPGKLKVYLRMDKRFFYSDEDIILKVCIKNVSEIKKFFDIYDSSKNNSSNYTTFQPVVYDMNGREAEIIVPYRLENRQISDLIKGLEKRMVELAPGEIIIHSINLKDIYNLKLNKKYRTKSFFYPDFEKNVLIKSDNELSFKIFEEKIYNKKSEIDAIQRVISPKEIILLKLNAEKEKEWDSLIKYINIEKFINSYSNFVKRYYRANFEEKSLVEKDFIKFLSRDRDDYILAFKIISEEVEKDKKIAYVDVIIDRFGIKRTNRYKYMYTLEKHQNLWLITDLETTVMKGIKR